MKAISFQDLLLVSTFTGLNEIDLLSPKWDKDMINILDQIGFDIKKPIAYIPCKHRTLANKVVIGFRAVGEVSTDPRHKHQVYFSLIDRIIAANILDPSLGFELASMGHHDGTIFQSATNRGLMDHSREEAEELPPSQLEPDYHATLKYIIMLCQIRDEIRGQK